ncbi:MAG: glycosyltransferase [Lutibacter sp.]|nr:glycosyltransferase [Lutibacter sp.]
MKVTFFSNFLNHHQTPFCDEMFKLLNGNFTFVSTMMIPESFLNNGYPDCTDYPYNLNSYNDKAQYENALQLGLDSDIVIIGSAPEIFIKERIKANKTTFRYYERLLKKGNWQLLDPRILYLLLRNHTIYRNKNLYMLCASAYTANDLNLFFAYPEKKYKWGYFTEVEELDIEQVIAQKPKQCIQLLWTGRFIDWKHPELVVKLAFELKKRGYNFHLNMIGVGVIFESIKKLIEKLNVTECVSLLGSMPNNEVRNYMKKSNIFLFTSNQNEGWGAVLNEAMSCGCAVVASNTIGATPYLIEHEKNGLIFKSGRLSSLVEQTEKLLRNKLVRDQISKNAYYTLLNEWSPQIAASNFLMLAQSIIDGQIISIEKGTCSKAKNTNKNFWKNRTFNNIV